jgi:pyruvate ferredoxin oxidoreductase beta subunit
VIQARSIDPAFEDNFVRAGSFLDMEIFRNRRIGTYNRESILLHREIPEINTKDPDYRQLKGNLSPGLSTCVGCAAPVVFNLVAKAAQMRHLFLKRALIRDGILTMEELERPEVMKVLLNETEPTEEEIREAAIDKVTLKKSEEIKVELIEEGVYFKLIFAGATGCMTVTTASYPNNIWRLPYFHSAFENIGAVVSGLQAGVQAKITHGKLKTPHKVIGFAGDGGSFDIGIQALSGLWERNQDSLIITYDNEAYMNTGKQRCSSTPWGANTTTSPVGRIVKGKQTDPKDIISIAISHNIPYVATASPDDAEDLINKVRKALLIPGAAYLRILAPCPPGWGYEARDSINLSKAAVDAATFYSFEVETDLRYRRRYFTINNVPSIFFSAADGRTEVTSYTAEQGRFKHMRVGKEPDALGRIQGSVDSAWRNLIEFFGLNGEHV